MNTLKLKRLSDIRSIDLDEEFLGAAKPSDHLEQYSHVQVEATEEEILLDEFDSLISEQMAAGDKTETQYDAAMAVRLHQSLPMSRRQAADRNMWAWLGVLHAPDFVARRWSPKEGVRSANRFMGDRVRQTYSRLWWAAELSRDTDDYTVTEKLLSLSTFQQVNEDLFGRAFSQCREALEQFVHHIEGMKEADMQSFAMELTVIFSTRPPECMSAEELSALFSTVKSSIVKT